MVECGMDILFDVAAMKNGGGAYYVGMDPEYAFAFQYTRELLF